MAMKWIISGTGRGVGKTRLAVELRGVLPNAVCAKKGHGSPQADKQPNYFQTEEALAAFVRDRTGEYEHVLLESNCLSLLGPDDLLIFVDGTPRDNDVRADANDLRSAADIYIGPGATVRGWRGTLHKKLTSGATCDAVCDILVHQQRFVLSTGLTVKSKVWFESAGMHVFGSGLARLLQEVNRLGTLAEAARACKMSYRHAWDVIRNAEKHIGRKLTIPEVGGRRGGRSALSTDGADILESYRQLSEEVEAFANERFTFHIKRKTTSD